MQHTQHRERIWQREFDRTPTCQRSIRCNCNNERHGHHGNDSRECEQASRSCLRTTATIGIPAGIGTCQHPRQEEEQQQAYESPRQRNNTPGIACKDTNWIKTQCSRHEEARQRSCMNIIVLQMSACSTESSSPVAPGLFLSSSSVAQLQYIRCGANAISSKQPHLFHRLVTRPADMTFSADPRETQARFHRPYQLHNIEQIICTTH